MGSSNTAFLDEATRRIAGGCYLALRTGDRRHLSIAAEAAALECSGLAGMRANLCIRHGIDVTRHDAIQGLQLSATNKFRWEATRQLLETLAVDGIEPVLFKGGALHVRWPEMRDVRAMFDYDLIVPQDEVERLRTLLSSKDSNPLPKDRD